MPRSTGSSTAEVDQVAGSTSLPSVAAVAQWSPFLAGEWRVEVRLRPAPIQFLHAWSLPTLVNVNRKKGDGPEINKKATEKGDHVYSFDSFLIFCSNRPPDHRNQPSGHCDHSFQLSPPSIKFGTVLTTDQTMVRTTVFLILRINFSLLVTSL